MSAIHFNPESHWLVVFGPSRAEWDERWGSRQVQRLVRCLDERFQHCWAFQVTVAGWLVFNPGLDGFAIREVCGVDLYTQSICDPANTVVRVPARPSGRLRLGWPQTCATQIAGLVGADRFRGVTPQQLFNHLFQHHDVEVISNGFRPERRQGIAEAAGAAD